MKPSESFEQQLMASRRWRGNAPGATEALLAAALLLGGCHSGSDNAPAPVNSSPLHVKPLAFNELNDSEEFNASGVVPLDEGRFLFCDNHQSDALFELNLTADGKQQGALIRRPLQGLNDDAVDDLEGMTMAEENGRRFVFVASSLSLKKALKNLQDKPTRVATDGLLRVTVNQDHGLSTENVPGFRAWLIEHNPELAEAAKLSPNSDGLNIEGLAWDRQRHALLFGVRSPVPAGKLLVLAVKVKDLAGAWTTGNLEMLPTIRLTPPPMPKPEKEEQGIRSLEYIAALNAYLVILGKSNDDSSAPFTLCTWDGLPEGTLRPLPVTFSKKMKPEGVTAGTVGGQPVLLFVDDGGGYQTLPLDALPKMNDKPKA
ncbi:MAG: hypothetical protein HYR56_30695 [Acidobacteria bacterium]|nr:hypothetical protein [Acidobacteriota bacterium]MBI3427501.1 hypothetical protein [Acidobacteriota bacterium]